MNELGLETAKSGLAHSLEEAAKVRESIAKVSNGTGFPVIIRPSFTLGGTGGGSLLTQEFYSICRHGLEISPVKQLLIEESLIGWKEFEMEVVRDKMIIA